MLFCKRTSYAESRNEPIFERIMTNLVRAIGIFLNVEKFQLPRPLKLIKSTENDQNCKEFPFFTKISADITNFGKYFHFGYQFYHSPFQNGRIPIFSIIGSLTNKQNVKLGVVEQQKSL